MATQAQAQLLQLIETLPAGENPYVAISQAFKEELFPAVPRGALYQLYVLAAAFGMIALLVLVSLVIKIHKRIFWTVRVSRSPFLIRPHANLWSVLALVALAINLALMSREINFVNRNVDPCFGWWMSCSWMALWSAGHVGIHSTATSYILHLQSTTGEGYPLSCWFSNLVGVGSIPLYLALVVPLSVLAGHHYYDAMTSFEKINALLLSTASTWTDGTPVNLVALLPAVPLLDALTNNINRFMTFFRAVFIVYAFTALFLAIAQVVLAVLYLSSLRRMLAETSKELSSFGNWTFGQQSRMTAVRPSEQQRRVQRTLRSLCGTIAGFSALGLFFSSIGIVASVSPLSLVTSPLNAQLVMLGPPYALVVVGAPLAVLLVLRAVDARPKERMASTMMMMKEGKGEGEGKSGLPLPLGMLPSFRERERDRREKEEERRTDGQQDITIGVPESVVSLTTGEEEEEERSTRSSERTAVGTLSGGGKKKQKGWYERSEDGSAIGSESGDGSGATASRSVVEVIVEGDDGEEEGGKVKA